MWKVNSYTLSSSYLILELPQFLLSKYESKGIIGITQPRRVAAVSLARRVAEEQGTILRNKVPTLLLFLD
jgi:hypothetical protein